jgi:hypothetical protein
LEHQLKHLINRFKSAAKQWTWPSWIGQKSILLCEVDIHGLRAAVMRYDGSMQVDIFVQSTAANLDEAVDEVVAGLRARGWRGQHAVVLTHAALYTMMELPVHPKANISNIEMQDMLAWDFEPFISQHATSWTEQSLLMALGTKSDGRLQEMAASQKDGVIAYASGAKELGDELLKTKEISRSQVDRCRLHLDWLRAETDESFYSAWAPQISKDAELDNEGYPWLVTGMPVNLVQRWRAVFAKHKINLKALYPLAGIAASLVKVDTEALLLEIHAGLVCGVHLSAGRIREVRQRQASPESLLQTCQEIYHEIGFACTDVFLVQSEALIVSDMALAAYLGCKVQVLDAQRVSPFMLACAHHVFKRPDVPKLCAVPARAYLPIWWKRAEIRMAIGAWLLLLVIGAVELAFQFHHGLAEEELMQQQQKKDGLLKSQAVVQKRVDEVNNLIKERSVLLDTLNSMTLREDFFGTTLAERSVFVQELLIALERSSTEDVILDSVTENANDISIAGWALSETSALQYIQTIKAAMKNWGMTLNDTNVEAKIGSIGITGYDFRFKLVPIKAETEIMKNDKGVKP